MLEKFGEIGGVGETSMRSPRASLEENSQNVIIILILEFIKIINLIRGGYTSSVKYSSGEEPIVIVAINIARFLVVAQ